MLTATQKEIVRLNRSSSSVKKILFAILLIAVLATGVLLMTARGQGGNFITAQVKIEAKVTGRDPCDILLEWRTEARQADDTKLALTIEAAEKFMGCRNQQKRRSKR